MELNKKMFALLSAGRFQHFNSQNQLKGYVSGKKTVGWEVKPHDFL
jgi:hypothetical protein